MNSKIEKRIYTQPQLVYVKLDNDISLALESAPPEGPNEVMNRTPEYFNNEPFKSNMG